MNPPKNPNNNSEDRWAQRKEWEEERRIEDRDEDGIDWEHEIADLKNDREKESQ